MRDDLIDEGFGVYFGEGEFFFSRESDGCSDYFIRTRSQTPDLVFKYDGDTIRSTNYSFISQYRNPGNYLPESVSANRSGVYEAKTPK